VSAPAQPNRLWRLVESPVFVGFILAVIIANAVVLGLQTYDEIEQRHGETLNLLNDLFLAIFVIELALRMGASDGARRTSSARAGTSSTSS
jgi:voltage-gated sodium channel